MKNNLKITTSFWFIAAVIVLLLNDFLFKDLYGNWWTGKLSDFAGLIVFSLFWTALFPKHKNKIFWSVAMVFIYWKSSYSQPFIDFWNNTGLLPISRVVDYTDLIALSVLPLANYIEQQKHQLKRMTIQPIVPLLVAAFSFMATSYSSDIDIDKEYKFNFSKQTLEKRIFLLPTIANRYRTAPADSTQNDTLPIYEFISDTMEIFVHEDFCFDGYRASIIISGDERQSSLKLSSFHHDCPNDEEFNNPVGPKTLVESFEEKVVERIKLGKKE